MKSIIRPNESQRKAGSVQVIPRKPPASAITPRVAGEIVYRFEWQQRAPRDIAKDLSRGPVALSTDAVNAVIRAELRSRSERGPKGPAPVIQLRKAA